MRVLIGDNFMNSARRVGRCPRTSLYVNGGSTISAIATLDLLDFEPAVAEAPEFFLSVVDMLPVGSRVFVTNYRVHEGHDRAFYPSADNASSPWGVPARMVATWTRELLVVEHELGPSDNVVALPTAVLSAWDRPANAKAKKPA